MITTATVKTQTTTSARLPDPNASADWPTVSFFVPGDPMTKGDHTAQTVGVRTFIREKNAGRKQNWRAHAADLARAARGAAPIFDEAIRVSMLVMRVRPKGHFGVKGLKASAPSYPTSKPDLDKLQRSLGDALNGVLWRDDAQISSWNVARRWAGEAGILVTVEPEHD